MDGPASLCVLQLHSWLCNSIACHFYKLLNLTEVPRSMDAMFVLVSALTSAKHTNFSFYSLHYDFLLEEQKACSKYPQFPLISPSLLCAWQADLKPEGRLFHSKVKLRNNFSIDLFYAFTCFDDRWWSPGAAFGALKSYEREKSPLKTSILMSGRQEEGI